MSPRQKARTLFLSAIALLCLSALTVYLTISEFNTSERRVIHSHLVQANLGDVESSIAAASRARMSYILTGDDNALSQYSLASGQITEKLHALRTLTLDNPGQQTQCNRLEGLVQDRARLWEQSIASRNAGPSKDVIPADIVQQSIDFSRQIVTVTDEMKSEEARLLRERTVTAHQHLAVAGIILLGTFVSALLFFLLHYRFLNRELRARAQAEHIARAAEQASRASNEAARQLSARLMHLQDEERRRFSRELHDSLGQYLVSLKMNLSMLGGDGHSDAQRKVLLTECGAMVDQCISEVRTVSHLLHPPLLDEAGLASATEWYVAGFAQRSSIDVKVDIKQEGSRVPREVELTLFRVLQESLTNIHRHSQSKTADVLLEIQPDYAILRVKDQGQGMPPGALDRFQVDGKKTGVGLAGMQERIRDLRGQLRIESSQAGTTITALVPVSGSAAKSPSVSGSAA